VLDVTITITLGYNSSHLELLLVTESFSAQLCLVLESMLIHCQVTSLSSTFCRYLLFFRVLSYSVLLPCSVVICSSSVFCHILFFFHVLSYSVLPYSVIFWSVFSRLLFYICLGNRIGDTELNSSLLRCHKTDISAAVRTHIYLAIAQQLTAYDA
jgi:hypothetical protein